MDCTTEVTVMLIGHTIEGTVILFGHHLRWSEPRIVMNRTVRFPCNLILPLLLGCVLGHLQDLRL